MIRRHMAAGGISYNEGSEGFCALSFPALPGLLDRICATVSWRRQSSSAFAAAVFNYELNVFGYGRAWHRSLSSGSLSN